MSNNASGRMITEEGTVVNIADTLGGVEVDTKRDINFYSPKSGRILDEEGNIVNIADLIGGVETGRKEDIDLYYPASGNLIKEDGSVVNVAKALVERLSGGGGGGTSEGINLSYTLNKDGTYSSKSASKDSVFPSGNWYSKFIYVSDKTYTIDELIGHTIRTKEINVPTGVINDVRDIEITRDMITDIGNGTFAIIDSVSELPILTIITEEMVGIDIGGGFVLPSNVGTYLAYVDKSPDKQGYVFGSVSVKKALGKPYIDTSLMTSFYGFCRKDTNLNLLDKLDTSNGIDFTQMFSECFNVKSMPQLDVSNGKIFKSMFEKCYGIKTIPPLDTHSGTDFNSMFYQAFALETVQLIDTSNGTDFTQMFNGCAKVKSITITTAKKDFTSASFGGCTVLENLTIGEGWAVSIYLQYAKALTQESLHGMIENLADLTGQTAKKFQIGATNIAKIDEEHINMLNVKNWEYS